MLDQKTINTICDHAAVSDLAKVNWQGRGKAPIGFIKGLAATYGLCLQKLMARDSAALAMVRTVDEGYDVFDIYQSKLESIGLMTGGATPSERLRALFVILAGLGMRESSGRYCEGRDRSASNTTAETAEAGLFQQSWDSKRASPEIEKLLKAPRSGTWAWEIFREGVKSTAADMEVYGDGDGAKFQQTCKLFPEFAVQCAAIGLRTLYTHWGPIVRREVEIRQEADALFRQVEEIVNVDFSAQQVGQENRHSWVSALMGAVMTLFRRGPSVSPPVPMPAKPVTGDLATRIVMAMRKRGYRIDGASGQINTVYVEGMGPDGTKNDNTPNQFNDARFVIGFENFTKPKILGAWEATTEPSRYWTEHRMNAAGAARIKHGQYTAWQVGDHHGHEALVQTGGQVTVCRDGNEDFRRDGDKEDTGFFGINQHAGYDLPKGDLGTSSAGCLVGRTFAGHREFMKIVKSDPRYIANNRFVFTAAVLPASEV